MTPLLEVDGLGRAYGAVKAVADLRFTVGEGEILGLIGPNGAGKTTAVNLISGTARPDAGTVRLRGEAVTGMPTHRLVRRGLVRTFQSTNVYGGRAVWHNVYRGTFAESFAGFWPAFFHGRTHRRAEALARACVDELLVELGLDGVRDVEARHLPYGRQKALGIAVALASNPSIVLLDEPAAGLSAEEADRVSQVVRQVNRRGVSAIVIDHNMRFIAGLCDRVVVMHHGTALCVGTPAEVVADRGVIEAYLGTDHPGDRP